MSSKKLTPGVRLLMELIAHKEGIEPIFLENVFLFSINPHYIGLIDNGLMDPECRSQLKDLYGRKNGWKDMADLYAEVCPEKEYSKEAMLTDNAFVGWNTKQTFEWNIPQGKVLKMTDSFVLRRKEYVDRNFFDYFFAYRLKTTDLSLVFDFLVYNSGDQFVDPEIKELILSDIRPGMTTPPDNYVETHRPKIRQALGEYFSYLKNILLPNFSEAIGEERIRLVDDYILDGQEPSVEKRVLRPRRIKQVKSEALPLESLFSEKYQLRSNAELFRLEIIEKCLKDRDGKLRSPKAKAAMCFKYLSDQGIWRNDIEKAIIASTLKKEIGLLKFSTRGLQPDRIKPPKGQLKGVLDKICWSKK